MLNGTSNLFLGPSLSLMLWLSHDAALPVDHREALQTPLSEAIARNDFPPPRE